MSRKSSRVTTRSVDEPSAPNPAVKSAGNAAAALTTTLAAKGLDAGWRAAFGDDSPSNKHLKNEDKRRKQDYKASLNLGEEPEKPRPAQEARPAWKLILFAALSAAAVNAAKIAAERAADFAINRRPPLNRG